MFEHHGAQANFVPGGPPTGSPLFLFPEGTNAASFSSSFTTLLAKDGITPVIGNKYGKGLGESQKTNFAPRVGFAYQVTPKLVTRGGFGLFYNGFENRGFSPNLGENYPFQFNFQFAAANDNTPITYPGCASPTATPIGSATLETGFSCTPLDPTLVNASGLALRGIQFKYLTPYSMGGNFTVQYQLTPSMSVQAGYVTSLARHLEVFPNSNNVTSIVPTVLPTGVGVNNFRPFPDFGSGASYATTNGNSWYHSLQTKVEKQFANGLNFLATYTFSKTRRTPATCLTEEACKVSALLMSLAPGSTMTTAWLLLIFATSSTLAAATNFPSARADAIWPPPRELEIFWPAGGASIGALPCRVASRSLFLVLRAQLRGQGATTYWLRDKARNSGCTPTRTEC